MAVIAALVCAALGFTLPGHRHVDQQRAGARPHVMLSAASSRFELLEFELPVQSDPTAYERLVALRAGQASEVIRWHISGPAAQRGMLLCEAVVLRPAYAAPEDERPRSASGEEPPVAARED
jgi:hypothetical protein